MWHILNTNLCATSTFLRNKTYFVLLNHYLLLYYNISPLHFKFLLYHFTTYCGIKSSCHYHTVSPLHHCTIAPLYHCTIFCVTTSPFHHFAYYSVSPLNNFTIESFHRGIIEPFHHYTMTPCNHGTMAPVHHFTIASLP